MLDFDAHLTDPQILHNQTYVEVTDSRFGTIRQPRFPARFSTGDAGIAPAPELDQDRDEVFGSAS